MDSAIPIFETPPTSHVQGNIIREGYSMVAEVLCEPLHDLHCEADITPQFFAVFDVFPFASGAQRLAFKGSIYERIRGADPIFRVHVVVKLEMAVPEIFERSLDERTRINEEEAKKTIRKHDLATNYANKWCDIGINKSVYVLSTEKLKITKGCSLSEISQERFPMLHYLFKKISLDSVLYKGAVGTVEDFLPGKFTKFLNNDGNSNSQVIANFPPAFAHWTWVESSGEMMISDIQGTRTAQGYVLTDPCVHSVNDVEGFGLSDLGQRGIEEFFEKHRCNELCNDLGLGKDAMDLDLGHKIRTRLISRKKEEEKEGFGRPNGFGFDTMNFGMDTTALEESHGKVQRRATLRSSKRGSCSNSSVNQRRTSMEEKARSTRKRHGLKKDDSRNFLVSGFHNLWRFRSRGPH